MSVLWPCQSPSQLMICPAEVDVPTHASDCALQHIMMDLGTGNNNKINWAMTDKQEFIDITEVVYRGARKGRGLVVRVQQVQLASL